MTLFEQTILPLFEERHPDWLTAARQVAAELGKDGREVTVDDVRERLPPPAGADPRVMGALFLRRDWAKVGYQNSERSTCHKRPVARFRRKDALA